jgi:hypothetical protein
LIEPRGLPVFVTLSLEDPPILLDIFFPFELISSIKKYRLYVLLKKTRI